MSNGFTLIELVISLLIQSILLAVCCFLALHSYQMIQKQYQLLDDQQGGLFVRALLRQEIKLAGYAGCTPLPLQTSITQPTPHHLIIRHATRPLQVIVSASHQQSLQVKTAPKQKKLMWLISDCQHTEQFSIASIAIQNQRIKLQLVAPLKHHYPRGSQLFPIDVIEFYWPGQGNDRTLYLRMNHEPKQTLLTHVRDFTVKLHHTGFKQHLVHLVTQTGNYQFYVQQRN